MTSCSYEGMKFAWLQTTKDIFITYKGTRQGHKFNLDGTGRCKVTKHRTDVVFFDAVCHVSDTKSSCIILVHRGSGRGRHPPGLRGREIGLWYAGRHKKRQAKAEQDSVCYS